VAAVAFALAAATAFAAHPLFTEDTGTQGRGNVEVELGNSWNDVDGNWDQLFQPQISYGASTSLDLIVQLSWVEGKDAQDEHARGLGDTNLDFKWRFYGSAPWSLGVRAGVAVPTAQHDLGLPQGTFSPHVVLATTIDIAPVTINADLGYMHWPPEAGLRTDLYHASAAMMLAASSRLTLLLDVGVDSNPRPNQASWGAVALVGFIYTWRPGLDFDAGYRDRLNSGGGPRQWLIGVTVRGAP
jgi:hypothetical protein